MTNKLVALFSLSMAERSEAKSAKRSFASKNLNFDFAFCFLFALISHFESNFIWQFLGQFLRNCFASRHSKSPQYCIEYSWSQNLNSFSESASAKPVELKSGCLRRQLSKLSAIIVSKTARKLCLKSTQVSEVNAEAIACYIQKGWVIICSPLQSSS